MVGKWSCKNPLTIGERRLIKEGLDLNMSYQEIGQYVGRHKSVVLRESKRLGDTKKYDPDKAQEHFEQKQIAKRKKDLKVECNCGEGFIYCPVKKDKKDEV
jgi:IS30 family transposase